MSMCVSLRMSEARKEEGGRRGEKNEGRRKRGRGREKEKLID